MKTRHLYTLLVLLFVVGLACSPDDNAEPTAQELAFEILSGSWDLTQGGSIVVDGQDLSLNYPGFGLSFTNGGYGTTNAEDLFNASGTWTWADDEAQMITLDDGKQITIRSLNETEFVFSFSFSGSGGQANLVDGIAGSYVISVNK